MGIADHLTCLQAPLVAQLVKTPPAMWETWVCSLGWEDPLEKGKATHPSILAWRIPWVAKSQTQLSNFHFSNNVCLISKQKSSGGQREKNYDP